jgi:tRNA threonylcarbamoyl adenosine modification protein YjeE
VVFRSESPEATRGLGAALGRLAQPGDVIALYGDLGAGKTCLVQGLAAGLGVTEPVTSPTFILIAEHAGRITLHHVDLYRTETLDEVRALGIEDLFGGDGVTVIEWGDRAEPLLPDSAVRVTIQGVGDEPREIAVAGLARSHAGRLAAAMAQGPAGGAAAPAEPPSDPAGPHLTERELDGSLTEYHEVDVAGDRVERLLRELFTEHWAGLTVGPLIQGAVFELRFREAPRVTLSDGYLTVDLGAGGAGHFHLCVNDHRETTRELAAIRRVGRAAFFRTRGGGHVPMTWGLRLWNGRGEQMVTVLFPSAYLSDALELLAEPDWTRVELWGSLRARYVRPSRPGASSE